MVSWHNRRKREALLYFTTPKTIRPLINQSQRERLSRSHSNTQAPSVTAIVAG